MEKAELDLGDRLATLMFYVSLALFFGFSF